VSALLEQFGIGAAQTRAEAWRYSQQALRALEQLSFVDASASIELAAPLIARFDWPQTRGRRLVFLNGVLVQALSDGRAITDAEICHGADNRMLVTIAQGAQPLHLVYANMPGGEPGRWQAQHEIRVLGGSAQIVEQHLGENGTTVLGALTSTIHVATGAALCLTTLSDLPDAVALYRRVQIEIAAQASCSTTHALFGGRLQRFDLDVALAGAQARLASAGTFALRGREHVDVHLALRHGARDTQSEVSWRGVADQRARGIFHGAINVAAGADGADARLQTRNLLLSDHAEIDAQPVLEIHADEVRASHGATVGRLDDRALFYLRSRGIPLRTARALLIAAFCREVFDGVSDAVLRERLDAALRGHLPQEAQA
jgi:Fe-S cluster assembly protein SufD